MIYKIIIFIFKFYFYKIIKNLFFIFFFIFSFIFAIKLNKTTRWI